MRKTRAGTPDGRDARAPPSPGPHRTARRAVPAAKPDAWSRPGRKATPFRGLGKAIAGFAGSSPVLAPDPRPVQCRYQPVRRNPVPAGSPKKDRQNVMCLTKHRPLPVLNRRHESEIVPICPPHVRRSARRLRPDRCQRYRRSGRADLSRPDLTWCATDTANRTATTPSGDRSAHASIRFSRRRRLSGSHKGRRGPCAKNPSSADTPARSLCFAPLCESGIRRVPAFAS